MRLLILVNEFPPGPGGVGTHAYELAKQMIKLNHKVVVVCAQNYKSDNVILNFNKIQSFPIYTYPKRNNYPSRFLSRIVLFRKTISSHKIDVVIASGSTSIWIAALFRLFLGSFKLVIVTHGGELTFRPWIRKVLTLWGCKIADRIISVSEYTKSHLPKSLNTRATVINNGANHQLFKNKNARDGLREKYGFEGSPILLTVGSVSERKGQDIVIKALKRIVESYPNTVYLMAGRSNNLEFFMELSRQVGVEKHVHFLGSIDNEYLVNLYNLVDLYVLTSRHSSDGDFEGFGISVIEAALCGVPAIVARNSGLVEAIEEGVTGISVAPNDEIAVANGVIKLMEEDLRNKMGYAAMKRAEQNFSWEKIATKYNKILSDL